MCRCQVIRGLIGALPPGQLPPGPAVVGSGCFPERRLGSVCSSEGSNCWGGAVKSRGSLFRLSLYSDIHSPCE